MVQYVIDKPHSSISFSVKHMMVSNVKGTFDSYSAKIEADSIEDLTKAKIEIVIDVASISTKDDYRDKHLVSADFFHADQFPKIHFVSTDIVLVENNTYHMNGNLTIKDVSEPIQFIIEYKGHVKSPWGQDTYGFHAYTKVNRKKFNLLYNKALESGGILIGENVDVSIDVEIHPV